MVHRSNDQSPYWWRQFLFQKEHLTHLRWAWAPWTRATLLRRSEAGEAKPGTTSHGKTWKKGEEGWKKGMVVFSGTWGYWDLNCWYDVVYIWIHTMINHWNNCALSIVNETSHFTGIYDDRISSILVTNNLQFVRTLFSLSGGGYTQPPSGQFQGKWTTNGWFLGFVDHFYSQSRTTMDNILLQSMISYSILVYTYIILYIIRDDISVWLQYSWKEALLAMSLA